MKNLPFGIAALAAALSTIYDSNPKADPWPPVYAAALNEVFPGVMEVQEWDNRLRATGRQHHMYQDRVLSGVRNPDWATWYATDFVTRYEQELPLYSHVRLHLAPTNAETMVAIVEEALKAASVSKAAMEEFAVEVMASRRDPMSVIRQWVSVS